MKTRIFFSPRNTDPGRANKGGPSRSPLWGLVAVVVIAGLLGAAWWAATSQVPEEGQAAETEQSEAESAPAPGTEP